MVYHKMLPGGRGLPLGDDRSRGLDRGTLGRRVGPASLYTLSGFLVGVLVGLTGVGGGSLMTPILVLLFGVHPATAVGTDLLFAAATKTVGTLVHGAGGISNGGWSACSRWVACRAVHRAGAAVLGRSRWVAVRRGLNLALGIVLLITSAFLLSARSLHTRYANGSIGCPIARSAISPCCSVWPWACWSR